MFCGFQVLAVWHEFVMTNLLVCWSAEEVLWCCLGYWVCVDRSYLAVLEFRIMGAS